MTDAPGRSSTLYAVLLVVGSVSLLAPLVLHAYLGTFTRYMGDDYCNAWIFRNNGLVGGQKYLYTHWGAVPTTIMLVALTEPGGPGTAGLLPAIALFVWVPVLAWTAYQLAIRLNLTRPLGSALFLSELLIFVTLRDTPNVVQSLYLRVPMLAYTCPLIALSSYVGFLICAVNRRAADVSLRWLLGSAALSFVAGAFGPVYVAMQTVALGIAVLAVWAAVAWPLRRAVLRLVICGLIGSVLALVFVAVAPGNTARQAYFPPPPGWFGIGKVSVLSALFMVSRPILLLVRPLVITVVPALLPEAERWLARALEMSSSPWTPTLLLLVAMGMGMMPRDDAARGWERPTLRRWILGLPVAAFVLVVAAMAPGAYGTSSPPPPRALIIPQFMLTCLTICWGYAVGRALSGFMSGDVHRVRALRNAALVASVALVVWQSAAAVREQARQVPRMRSWAESWDRVDRELRAAKVAGVRNPTVPALEQVSGVGSIGSDPANWVNGCAALYYGFDSITGR